MAWVVQGGRRWLQAAHPARKPPLAISGVARPQGVVGSGRAGPGEMATPCHTTMDGEREPANGQKNSNGYLQEKSYFAKRELEKMI
jgi:hypothetical protein